MLRNGPLAAEPHDEPDVSRTLQVRGDQTLDDLHRAVATAFDRPCEYSYEIQLDAGPLHPEGKRYVLPAEFAIAQQAGNPAAGRVTDTTLDALGLETGQRFGYWPDTGEDWWHPIEVERIADHVPRGKFPRVTKRKGESPFRDMDRKQAEQAPLPLDKDASADTACLVAEGHLSRGEYLKAIEAFSRAVEAHPTADAYEGRARAYRALADEDEQAAQELRQDS